MWLKRSEESLPVVALRPWRPPTVLLRLPRRVARVARTWSDLGVSQRSLQIREETVENTQQDENGGPLGFFLFLLMYVVGTERVTWPKK